MQLVPGRLQELCVAQCRNMDGRLFRLLAAQGAAETLVYLDVSHCRSIEVQDFRELRLLTSLRRLKLSNTMVSSWRVTVRSNAGLRTEGRVQLLFVLVVTFAVFRSLPLCFILISLSLSLSTTITLIPISTFLFFELFGWAHVF